MAASRSNSFKCLARVATARSTPSTSFAAIRFLNTRPHLTFGHISSPLLASRPTLPSRLYSTEKQDATKGAEDSVSEAATAEATSSPNQTSEQDAKVTELGEQIELKNKQIAELKDARLRTLADFENLQKISVREKAQAKDFALTSFAKDLISSIDILSLALKSIPDHKVTKGHAETPQEYVMNDDLVSLYHGVSLTKQEIEKVLKRHGVVPFDPTGEAFDPNKHEALYQAPVPGKEPGSILECQEIGYMIKDRLLRPAKVGVVLSQDV